MSRQCIVCGKEIDGRRDKRLCSNSCRIAICRLRKKTVNDFKELVMSIKDKQAIFALMSVIDDLAISLPEKTN